MGPIQDGDGIYSSLTFSGTVIRDNIVQHNARGMRLHSNGITQSVVKKNCVRDNNFGPPATLTGQGIYLSAPASKFLIEHNFTTLNGIHASIMIVPGVKSITDVALFTAESLLSEVSGVVREPEPVAPRVRRRRRRAA